MSTLVYLCDDQYTVQDFVEIELQILGTLDYRLMAPTSYDFVMMFLAITRPTKRTVDMCGWLLDETCLSYKVIKYRPSKVAAAVMFLAQRHTGCWRWSHKLKVFSTYSEEDIIPIARLILDEMQTLSRLHAIRNKYDDPRFEDVLSTTIVADF